MECYYDSLFECDCEGIAELIKVPCTGNVYTTYNYRQPWGLLTPGFLSFDRKLEKRINWIASCAGAESLYIIVIDDWKTNRWKIFMQVPSIRVYYDPQNPWAWEGRELKPNHCYYLGQYPWYWDFTLFKARGPMGHAPISTQTEAIKKRISTPRYGRETWVYAPKVLQFGVWVGGGYWKPKESVVMPFEMTPTYPDVNYDLYKNRDEEENRFFLGDPVVDTWNEQDAFIKIIERRLDRCIERKYPSE